MNVTVRRILTFLVAVTAVVLLLLATSRLPSLEGRITSHAIADTADSRLRRAIAPITDAHSGDGLSGVFALADGRDAFAARTLLADAADRSLDIQYYIWHGDMSGLLMLDALRRAADRGVRVRLLLDDNGISGLDALLAHIDAHANIEVRLFNPFPHRRWRWLGFITDFQRLNRRMHNKSFTADNQATIIGGRNIGDEYFDAGQDISFVDLDVLAIGPVVTDVSADFDRYWASESSYPADRLTGQAGRADMLTHAATSAATDSVGQTYLAAVSQLTFVEQLLDGRLEFEWARTTMVSDDPAKGLGLADEDGLLWPRLTEIVGSPQRELDLISPYFVPGKQGTDYFARTAARGVRVRILTNSLAATDVIAVHSGYARRRIPLVAAGVSLFELKPDQPSAARDEQHESSRGSVFGSSSASLHAKTFAVDGLRVFVGSFNFDPRSARLNTELGFIIESESMARRIEDAFDNQIRRHSYMLRVGESGKLQWMENTDSLVVHNVEPGTGRLVRIAVWVLERLPIEWLL